MQSDILILLIVNAFWILGFNRAASYELEVDGTIIPGSKNILWWVRWYGDKYLPWYLQKPLYDCPKCMGSLHSIYPFFFCYDFTLHNIGLWLIYFVALSGLANFIDNHG